MSIPVFSYIYVIILIFIFMCASNFRDAYISNLILLFSLELIWPQGYFIQFASTEYTLDVIQMYVLLALSLWYLVLHKTKLKGKLLGAGLFFLGIMILGIFYQAFFPYDGYVLPSVLTNGEMSWDDYVAGRVMMIKYEFNGEAYFICCTRIIRYLLIMYVIKCVLTLKDIEYIANKVITISFPVVLYGYIEMLLKNVINIPQSTYEFIKILFGASKYTYTWESATMMADGLYRLQGFTREPSHYVLSMLMFGILIFIMMKVNKYQGRETPSLYYAEIILIFILMPMTGGMSSIWCIFSLILAYIILNMNRQIKLMRIAKWVLLVFTALVIGGFVLQCLLDGSDILLIERFARSLDTVSLLISNPNTLLAAGMDGSTLARFTSIIVCMENWLDNPLFGLGVGITNAHDFTATMLVNNGILGCMAWYIFMSIPCNTDRPCDHLLICTMLLFMFLPIGIAGGWYTKCYFVLLFEITRLYAKKV